ncbi:glycoside hydrolase family 32 protein [Polychaeton citri CBS 116435]|uniref:Glycoside hydrolase family 32 protein n=1 Tax=Polychaeton citri CBS 116435 TaxID=1314669 RepID=A0A9P4Q107_9PEZI|nr:glycoside hydrolase family 32 protein [Polychaeton citri CBS 116435]
MKGVLPVVASAFVARQTNTSINIPNYNLAPPNLSTLANGSLFETWRPRAHILPPANHIGDPCMHYSDPNTGLFHFGYLYSSDETSGAAGATTDDFVTYRDVNDNPKGPIFIEPGGKNDPIAVFDGSVIPMGINGTPTLLYSSISYLPLHWTIPYTKGSETQSLAVSYDGGANFTKVNTGPSIPGAPYGSFALNVTGFRDPFVFQSPQFDRALDSEDGTWYVTVSGGIHDVSSSQFLYRQLDPEFRDWEYLGQWWLETPNSTWGDGTWAGRWGFNMEVANNFFLDADGYNPEGMMFTTIGTEGGIAPVPQQKSPQRQMLWAAGTVSQNASIEVTPWNSPDPYSNGLLRFEPFMAGTLDWGFSAYAAAGKDVPSSLVSRSSGVPDRYISVLWLTNDEFSEVPFPIDQQGWDGTLTTPRELYLSTLKHVVNNNLVDEVASWRIKADSVKSTVRTVELELLGQKVVREAHAAYTKDCANHFIEGSRTFEPGSTYSEDSAKIVPFSISPSSKFFMMQTQLRFPDSARNSSDVKAGFQILSSELESTKIYYQFSNESVIVDRSSTSAAALTTDGIATANETGKLRLFDILEPGSTTSAIEPLNLTVIVDNAVVEIYINDRFALSTWAWSWYANSTGIAFFYEGSVGVEFGDVQVYEGLVDAWPERPR